MEQITKPSLRPSSLNVRVTSRQEPLNHSGLRSWLVTIETDLAGHPMDMSEVTQTLDVTSARTDLQVKSLGRVDRSTAVYRVKESKTIQPVLDLPLSVRISPRYHLATGHLYKLEKRLGNLVGRTYYALTLVLAYVRAKNLQKGQVIICDKVLQDILGTCCPWIKSGHLWKRLENLIKKVDEEPVDVILHLADFVTVSCATINVVVDQHQNIFPSQWTSQSALTNSVILLKKTCTAPSLGKVAKLSRKCLKRYQSF